MKRVALALLATLLPVVAEAAGGGGAFVETQYIGRFRRQGSTLEAPGWIGCVGGVGYGAGRRGFRLGGEGAYCRGADGDVGMGYGGVQVGRWGRTGPVYLSFYGSLGFGMLNDRRVLDVQRDPYRSFYFYGKPTFSVGLPLGFLGVELGVFSMMPFNLVQWVGEAGARGIVTPTFGFQGALVFGNFKSSKKTREERWKEAPKAAPVSPQPTCPYHPDCTAPPPPRDGWIIPEAEQPQAPRPEPPPPVEPEPEPPLAIPG